MLLFGALYFYFLSWPIDDDIALSIYYEKKVEAKEAIWYESFL